MSAPGTDPTDRGGAGDEHGLPWLATPLRRTLETQQAHALLIHGPGGVGQFELALALAKGWLCEATDRPLVDRPCGRCASCKLNAAHSHPDLLVLVPEALRESLGWDVGGNEGDEAGEGGKRKPSKEIRVEAVRAAIAFATTTSARGRGKVVVVHPAERMNDVAASAFLKTLEEPAGDARFLLCSAAPDSLLPTIRSRCQQVVLPVPPAADAEAWLARAGRRAARRPARGQRRPAAACARPRRARHRRRRLARLAALGSPPATRRRCRAGAWPAAVDALQKICHDAAALAVRRRAALLPARTCRRRGGSRRVAALVARAGARRRRGRTPLERRPGDRKPGRTGPGSVENAAFAGPSRRRLVAKLDWMNQPAARAAAPSGLTVPAPAATRPSVIQLVFRERGALYAAYMPMFSEGGIFVPTTRDYKLGEDIYLLLSLPDDPQRYPVAGKVGWITPANASGGRTQGVGVRFPTDEKSRALRARIEESLGTSHLVGQAHADHLTPRRLPRAVAGTLPPGRDNRIVFVDSHCHLSSPELAGRIPEIRAAMRAASVDRALCICTTLDEFERVHALALANDGFWCSAGVHPDEEDSREPTVEGLVDAHASRQGRRDRRDRARLLPAGRARRSPRWSGSASGSASTSAPLAPAAGRS